MHLDEGIKALKAGDNQVALMHLGAADQTFRWKWRINTTAMELYLI
jgi:hypothetical protein